MIFIVLIITFGSTTAAMFSDPLLIPEKEAPEALLETKIQDAEVSFYLSGSWKAEAKGSTGLLIRPDVGLRALDYFPRTDTGLFLSQSPDLTFSVSLLERYFLDASILSNYSENTLLMSYEGKPGELLQQVALGNSYVEHESFRFFEIPEPGASSVHATARMTTGVASQHLLQLRYDAFQEGRKTFLGKSELHEEVLGVGDYVRGQHFFLPDADVVGVVVYFEDPGGVEVASDGRRYRRGSYEDYRLDAQRGLISLRGPAESRVLVHYIKDGLNVGHPDLGRAALPNVIAGTLDLQSDPVDFSFDGTYLGASLRDREVVCTTSCLLLWEPGEFSPFQANNVYSLANVIPADLAQVRIVTTGRNRTTEVVFEYPLRFMLDSDESSLHVYRSATYPEGTPELVDFYPFPDEEGLLYGPRAGIEALYPDLEIRVRILYPVADFLLEQDIMRGSVRVIRNGIPESRFSFDYETGRLEFSEEIAADDHIEISYRRKAVTSSGGDLLFNWGNRIPFSDSLNLELCSGLRWNALPGAYTDQPYSRTGTMLALATIDGTSPRVSFVVSAAGGYNSPDTTGTLRLHGMEGTRTSIEITEDGVFPSSVPSDDYLLAMGVVREKRGTLHYRDLRTYQAFGAVALGHYEAALPDPRPSQIGPYLAAGGSSGASGRSLVLDFEIDATQRWIGCQLPLGGGLADLAALQGVSFSYRALDVSGEFAVYLQMGEIGEDLDGDGELDAEDTEYSSGFRFDVGDGSVFLVGGGPVAAGNGRIDSEDVDGNGLLDAERVSRVVTIPIEGAETISADTGWAVASHMFTQVEKQQLSRTRGVRILVIRGSESPARGRIVMDGLSFMGTSFWRSAASAGEVMTRQITEAESRVRPEQTVDETYPEIGLFHPQGEAQEVLEVCWDDVPPDGSWDIETSLEFGTGGIGYERVALYLRVAQLVAHSVPALSFALSDGEGRGVRWSFEPQAMTTWQRLDLDLHDGRLVLNGQQIEGLVEVDTGFGSLTRFKVSLSGAATGVLYLDELHLKEPIGTFGAGSHWDLRFSLPDLRLNSIPLISDSSVLVRGFASSAGFAASLYGRPSQSWQANSLIEGNFEVLYARLNTRAVLEASQGVLGVSVGHALSIPSSGSPIVFSDSYELRRMASEQSIHRQNGLTLDLANVLSVTLDSEARLVEELVWQQWHSAARLAGETLDLAFSVDLGKSADGQNVSRSHYLHQWVDGFSYLLPTSGGTELERRGNLGLDIRLDTLPVGLAIGIALGFHSSDFTDQARNQRNNVAIDVALPVRFSRPNAPETSLTLGYARELVLAAARPEAFELACFQSEAETLLADLVSQTYAYQTVPVVELFAEDLRPSFAVATADYRESVYEAQSYVQLARDYGSRIVDLLLPAAFEFQIVRRMERELTLYRTLSRIATTFSSTALNLFGSYGAYPITAIYTSDEFSNSASIALDFDEDWAFSNAELGLDSLVSFQKVGSASEGSSEGASPGTSAVSCVISNRLRTTIGTQTAASNSLTVSLAWDYSPQGGIGLPFLRDSLESSGFISNNESLELFLTKKHGAHHPATVQVGHTSSVIFPDHGSLEGTISVGFDYELPSGSVRLLLRGALLLQVTF